MGGVGHAPVKGLLGLVIVGGGVGNGHGAQLPGLFHKLLAAGLLRGNIHQLHQTAAQVEQLLEQGEIGRHNVFLFLSAFALFGDEGPLHVYAHNLCPVLQGSVVKVFCRQQGLFNHLPASGHGGGAEGGHAVGQQKAGHGVQGLGGAVAGIRPVAAVNVHVHKAGDNGIALAVHGHVLLFAGQGGAGLDDFAPLHLNVPLGQAEVLVQIFGVDQIHIFTSLLCVFSEQYRVQYDKKRDPRHTQHAGRRQAEPV